MSYNTFMKGDIHAEKVSRYNGNVLQLIKTCREKGGLPPLPERMQASVDRILETYGWESEEYLFLAQKIVYVGGEWMINYLAD
jgi:hypothetical protein